MDSSSLSDDDPVSSSSKPPRKVRKDSSKITKKPPMPPHQAPPPPPPAQRTVIIHHEVPPKIIHVHRDHFKDLVQRLTGCPSSSSSSSSTTTSYDHQPLGGGDFSKDEISPAARYPSMERANMQNSPTERNKRMPTNLHNYHHQDINTNSNGNNEMDGDGHGHGHGGMEVLMDAADDINIEGSPSSMFPGILSSEPTSLPTISPEFFSPSDPNYSPFSSFLPDFSPAVDGYNTFIEGGFMPSPSSSSSSFLDNSGNIITSPSTGHRLTPSSSMFPGTLLSSSGPTSIPTISPGFFSPSPSDPNYSLFSSFSPDLSPAADGNSTLIEGGFMPSPSSSSSSFLDNSENIITLPSTDHHVTPSSSTDLFDNSFDS